MTLSSEKIVAFVATADAQRARIFYRDTLGLKLMSEDEFSLVFDANGTTLRITKVDKVVMAPYTVLGWQVSDAAATAAGSSFYIFRVLLTVGQASTPAAGLQTRLPAFVNYGEPS